MRYGRIDKLLQLTMIVWDGNLCLTRLTNSTKCSEYPLATSRHMNSIAGTAPITSVIFVKSASPVPELIAMFYNKSTQPTPNNWQTKQLNTISLLMSVLS